MVKAAPPPPPTGPGIYSATYSGIPVYEYQFGHELKEHVMRRRHDDWINATHILKAAGFDKPARTRILERDVQKDVHEKIQGGYGKYQGTWIPLESGEALAHRHSVYDRLRPMFEYVPGDQSPPPAPRPRHASKPKAPKVKPPLPKWGASKPKKSPAVATETHTLVPGTVPMRDDFENTDSMIVDDDTPDNITIASASYMADEDRYDMAHVSTGHRRRKREEHLHDLAEQQHAMYGDELLDYFLLSRNGGQAIVKPDPPPNFQSDWPIDAENHTALHWACAMGDISVVRQLKRFNASISAKNARGETPFMRSVNFTNCYERQTFSDVMKELWDTVTAQDVSGCTVIHHAAIMKNCRLYSPTCSRFYLDSILTRLDSHLSPSALQQMLDIQDSDGNTALHLAAQRNARKCVRSLLGRNASTDIPNNEGIRAEDLIAELNAAKKDPGPQRSSSPFAPDSQRHASFRDALKDKPSKKTRKIFGSAAATTVQSRIAPLLEEKFADLAKSYDEEWNVKDRAESEARRILTNTQAELQAAHEQIAKLETQLEPDEVATQVTNEANLAKHHVLSLITHQNRLHISQTADGELSRINGDGGQDESYEERLNLARQLSHMIAEQRIAETEYVDALSMVGVGDKIDKYRRLLKRCLDPKDSESLDNNIDSVIGLMEEDRDLQNRHGPAEEPEPMDIPVGI